MKLLTVGLIAGSILIGFTGPQQPDPQGLIRAIVSVVEPDIELHRRIPQARTDGPRYIDVGSFVQGIQATLGKTISTSAVLAANGPAAVPAAREQVMSSAGVRDGGIFIRLDSLRAVREGSDRLIAFVHWEFTQVRPSGASGAYARAFRMCLDLIEERWTVVESRQVPPVRFPFPPPQLDCEQLARYSGLSPSDLRHGGSITLLSEAFQARHLRGAW